MTYQEKDDKSSDPYSIRYVAFVDILGFSEIVAKNATPERTAQRHSLVKALRSVGAREIDKEYGDDFRLQQFSDSIIMSDRDSPVGLFNLLDAVSDLACALLENELLIRGGIAKGPLHHDDQLVFGPAFLDAYRIESTIAKYPRVVISPAVMEDARTYLRDEKNAKSLEKISDLKYLRNLIRLSDDGPAAIHILHDTEIFNTDKAAQAITNLLHTGMHEPRHYEKLKWFAIYWNESVSGTSLRSVSLDRSDWLR